MRYYKTSDVWEAIAVAAQQNNGKEYDSTTARMVEVAEYNGTYYVMRLEDCDNLGIQHVDYDTMALDFPPLEI